MISGFADDWQFVRRLVREHGVSSSDIDDVTQDTILALLRAKVHSWKHKPPGGAPAGGDTEAEAKRRRVCRMVVAGFVEYMVRRRRLQARRLPLLLSADPAGEPGAVVGAPSVEDAALAEERRALVHAALVDMERRAPDLATVLYRFEIEGHEMVDVAAGLDIPTSDGWERLRRARAELAAAVRQRRPHERIAR